MAQSDIEALAGELDRTAYHELFGQPDTATAMAFWNRQDPEAVLRLALDPARSWKTRFLAAELIFNNQMFLVTPEHFVSLAPVYAKALQKNGSDYMSDWGFLDDMSDAGKLGSRFILFGRDANEVLKPLLDNSLVVPYIYPREFPSQIRLGLRIKDFAALYLSKINRVPIQFTEDPAQRDREIDRLRLLV